MHELGLAEDIVKKIKALADEKKIKKVNFVKISIGETLVSDKEELLQIINMLSAGTLLEGMKIEAEIAPLAARCANCHKDFKDKSLRFNCPECESTDIQIVSGTTTEILEIK